MAMEFPMSDKPEIKICCYMLNQMHNYITLYYIYIYIILLFFIIQREICCNMLQLLFVRVLCCKGQKGLDFVGCSSTPSLGFYMRLFRRTLTAGRSAGVAVLLRSDFSPPRPPEFGSPLEPSESLGAPAASAPSAKQSDRRGCSHQR